LSHGRQKARSPWHYIPPAPPRSHPAISTAPSKRYGLHQIP